MNTLMASFYSVYRRPLIIFIIGTTAFTIALVNHFNPVMPILSGLDAIGTNNFLSSAISMLQYLWEPNIVVKAVAALITVSAIAALLLSGIFSGCFNMIGNSVAERPVVKGEFIAGFKKYYWRLVTINIRVFLIYSVYIMLVSVAVVPSLALTRAATGSRPQMFLAAIFVDTLTVFVLFFSSMFLRIYTLYWYPALYNGFGNAFAPAKRIADSHFWKIVRAFLCFDMIFILFHLLAGRIFPGASALSFFLKWLFNTLYFSIYSSYIFNSFSVYVISRNCASRS